MINAVSNLNGIQSPKPHQNTRLSLFVINDTHGNFDYTQGMEAASDYFDKKYNNENTDTIKLSAGDNFSGANDKRNKLMLNLLKRMGIDASAVGNHEFDASISSFYKYLNGGTKFLAINAKTPENSQFYNYVQGSTIIEENGTKYGIIGLLPFDLAKTTGNNDEKLEGIRPYDMDTSVELVNKEVEKLQKQGIDRIILVSHIGNDKDKEIASRLHGVDVIVGGHSHTEVKGIKNGENLYNNADNDPVVIVQTGENAKNVGILNVEFNDKGAIISAENNLIEVNREKSPVLEYMKDATMGKSPQIATLFDVDPLPNNRRKVPCAWTNTMCDAMRECTNTDIAFINASNTRKVPKKGSITERDVSESTPLKNTLIVKEMTEKEVVKAIKDAVEETYSNETGEPGILHTSGIGYKADITGTLREMFYLDKQGNKTPIDINNPSDKKLKVCYDSFLVGGTEYPILAPSAQANPEIEQSFDFDKDKFMMDYLRKRLDKENLTIKDDGRIQIFDEKEKPLNAIDSYKEEIKTIKKDKKTEEKAVQSEKSSKNIQEEKTVDTKATQTQTYQTQYPAYQTEFVQPLYQTQYSSYGMQNPIYQVPVMQYGQTPARYGFYPQPQIYSNMMYQKQMQPISQINSVAAAQNYARMF